MYSDIGQNTKESSPNKHNHKRQNESCHFKLIYLFRGHFGPSENAYISRKQHNNQI